MNDCVGCDLMSNGIETQPHHHYSLWEAYNPDQELPADMMRTLKKGHFMRRMNGGGK